MTSDRPPAAMGTGVFAARVLRAAVLASALVFLGGAPHLRGEEPLRWERPAQGPMAVGFTAEALRDETRSFGPKHGLNGEVFGPDLGRPVQVLCWYPAAPSAGSAPMAYSAYVGLGGNLPDARLPSAGEREANIRAVREQLVGRGATEASVRSLLDGPSMAFAGAKALPGPFPVILYAPSFGSWAWENSALCEYLASHGYVVLSSPSMGENDLAMTQDAAGLLAQERDLAFLLSRAVGMSNADAGRIGVAGFSWGGLADVVLAMRDARVDAVVSLDGSIRSSEARQMVLPRLDLDARNLRVPFALLTAGGGGPEDDAEAFTSKAIYSERLRATFPAIVHRNFCWHFNAVARLTPGAPETSGWRGVTAAYDGACQLVLAFLDTHVKGAVDTPMPDLPKSLCSIERAPSLPAPPTEGQFLHVVLNQGAEKARAVYDRAKKADPKVVLFHEAGLNALGYYLLQNGRIQDAAGAFRLNTLEFPDSANAWDSLGEASLAAGDLDGAERCYRESIRLAPGDARLSPQTRKAIEEGGRKALETIAARRKAK